MPSNRNGFVVAIPRLHNSPFRATNCAVLSTIALTSGGGWIMPRAAVWESTVGCAFGAAAGCRPPAFLAVWPGTTATAPAPASAGGSVETGISLARMEKARVERGAEREGEGALLLLLLLLEVQRKREEKKE